MAVDCYLGSGYWPHWWIWCTGHAAGRAGCSQCSRDNVLLKGHQPQPLRALATLFPPKNPALEEGSWWRRQLPALAKRIYWQALLSPQSSKTQQGKLSGVLNCQMMLRPNTEVVPITTFALSHTQSLHIPVVLSFCLFTRYSHRRENMNLGLKHWAQVSLLCMQQVNPSLPQSPSRTQG